MSTSRPNAAGRVSSSLSHPHSLTLQIVPTGQQERVECHWSPVVSGNCSLRRRVHEGSLGPGPAAFWPE